LRDTWGRDRFDFLINNAGTSHHNPFEKTTEEEMDVLYNVHFKGVFFLTQKLCRSSTMVDGSSISRQVLPASSFPAVPLMVR
jgi:short-subunit dehydrogenase